MSAIAFDTLSTARRLREKDMSQELAEAIADELGISAQADLSHLATKEELNAFRFEVKSDMAALKGDMTALKGDMTMLKGELREAELRITIKLGAMIFALGGLLVAIKFLGHG